MTNKERLYANNTALTAVAEKAERLPVGKVATSTVSLDFLGVTVIQIEYLACEDGIVIKKWYNTYTDLGPEFEEVSLNNVICGSMLEIVMENGPSSITGEHFSKTPVFYNGEHSFYCFAQLNENAPEEVSLKLEVVI